MGFVVFSYIIKMQVSIIWKWNEHSRRSNSTGVRSVAVLFLVKKCHGVTSVESDK